MGTIDSTKCFSEFMFYVVQLLNHAAKFSEKIFQFLVQRHKQIIDTNAQYSIIENIFQCYDNQYIFPNLVFLIDLFKSGDLISNIYATSVKNNNKNIIQQLQQKGFKNNENSVSLFHIAINQNSESLVYLLYENGFNLFSKDNNSDIFLLIIQ